MATSRPQAAGPTLQRRNFFTRREILLLLIPFIVFFVAVFFFAPVVSATVPDGCLGCYVHYSESLSCAVLGVNGLGVTEWQGQYSVGCLPPEVP